MHECGFGSLISIRRWGAHYFFPHNPSRPPFFFPPLCGRQPPFCVPCATAPPSRPWPMPPPLPSPPSSNSCNHHNPSRPHLLLSKVPPLLRLDLRRIGASLQLDFSWKEEGGRKGGRIQGDFVIISCLFVLQSN
jgi:hypothetical protein